MSFTRLQPLLCLIALIFSYVSLAEATLQSQLNKAEAASDTNAVIEIVKRLLKENPEDTELLRKLARAQLVNKSESACKSTLVLLSEILNKPDAEILEMFGDIELSKKKNNEPCPKALEYWNEAIIIAPNRISTLVRLADYFRNTLGPEKEEIYLDRLFKLRTHPDDLVNLLKIAVQKRDWDALKKFTLKLREAFPSSKQSKSWGPVYDRLLKGKTKLTTLDARLQNEKISTEALLQRAWLFNEMVLDNLAVNDAKRAYEISPDSLCIKYQLGVILAHAGQANKALKNLQINFRQYVFKRRSPGQKIFSKLTDLEKRITNKQDSDAYLERAVIFYDEEQIALALEDLESAIKINLDNTSAHLLLGKIYAAENKTIAAKSAYLRVLKIQPKHLQALEQLGRLQMSLGDFEDATKNFKDYLEIQFNQQLQDLYKSCFASLQRAAR